MVCGKNSFGCTPNTHKILEGTSVQEQNSASKRGEVGLGQFLDTSCAKLMLLLTSTQLIFLLLYKSYSIEPCGVI